MVHSDPFGLGIPPRPGLFAHFDMLPPPEIMEQKLVAQHVEMQRLGTENQRIAATHGTLRQELAAAQHELQILHAQIGAVTSEREQQMRSLTDKIPKMEAELQAAEPVKLELQQAHSDAQNLRISIKDIKSHPWFLKNLPRELTEAAQATYYRKENPTFSLQSVDEIMKIVEEAKVAPRVSWPIGGFG